MDWEGSAGRIDHDSDRLLWEQIASDIAGLIAKGRLQPGERLPNEYDLADAYRVSRVTIRRAVLDLRARRVLVVRHGRGTYVAQPPD
jgi:DNA-binding GntR family transcriptional regulator